MIKTPSLVHVEQDMLIEASVFIRHYSLILLTRPVLLESRDVSVFGQKKIS